MSTEAPHIKKKSRKNTRNNVTLIPTEWERTKPRILLVVESLPSVIINFPFLILTLAGLENAKGLSQNIIDFNNPLHLVTDSEKHAKSLSAYKTGGGETQMMLKYNANKAFLPAFIATHAFNNGNRLLTSKDFQVISSSDFMSAVHKKSKPLLDFDVLIVTDKSIAKSCFHDARAVCGTSIRRCPIRIFPPIAHIRFVLDQYDIIANKIVMPPPIHSPIYSKIQTGDMNKCLDQFFLPDELRLHYLNEKGFYYTWMIVNESTHVLVEVTSKDGRLEGCQQKVLHTIKNAILFDGGPSHLAESPSVEDNVLHNKHLYSELLGYITSVAVNEEVIYVAPKSTNVFTGNSIVIYAQSPLHSTKATQFFEGMYYNVIGDGLFESHPIKPPEWDKLTHHSRSVPHNKCKRTHDSKHQPTQQTAKYYAERAYEAKASTKVLLHRYSTSAGNKSSHLPFRIVLAEYITKDANANEKDDKSKNKKDKYILHYTPLSVLPFPLYDSGSVTDCTHVNNSIQRDFRISGLMYNFIEKNYEDGCWGI